MAKQEPSRLAKAILETAKSLHKVGAMDDADYARIVERHSNQRPADAQQGAGRETPATHARAEREDAALDTGNEPG